MFKCGLCHKPSKHREKAFRVVTEKAPATYPKRWHPPSKEFEYGKEDPGGVRWRIVHEALAHQPCAEKFHNLQLEQERLEQERMKHGNQD